MLSTSDQQPSSTTTNFEKEFKASNGKTYKILPFKQEDFDETLRLTVELSVPEDVLSRHMGITKDEMTVFGRPIEQRSLSDNLGIVVKDEQGKIVAALLSLDEFGSKQEPSVDINSLSPKILALLEFYEHLHPDYKPTKMNEVIYIFFGVTHPDHRRQHLMSKLVEFLMYEHPLGSQAKVIYAQSPGRLDPGKLKWNVAKTLDPITYVNSQGKKPFEGLETTLKELGVPVPYSVPLVEFRR